MNAPAKKPKSSTDAFAVSARQLVAKGCAAGSKYQASIAAHLKESGDKIRKQRDLYDTQLAPFINALTALPNRNGRFFTVKTATSYLPGNNPALTVSLTYTGGKIRSGWEQSRRYGSPDLYDNVFLTILDVNGTSQFAAGISRSDHLDPDNHREHGKSHVYNSVAGLLAEISRFVADVAHDRLPELAVPKPPTKARSKPRP